jgi:hypothetical protein
MHLSLEAAVEKSQIKNSERTLNLFIVSEQMGGDEFLDFCIIIGRIG